VILSFKHKGLRRFFESGSRAGIRPEHEERLQDILTALNAATKPGHMDLPGFRLHPLKGSRAGSWAVTVRANWRVTFRFDHLGRPADVDYEDYH
jgi:proteic killer suppression protein